MLFAYLVKRFFPKLPLCVFLLLSTAMVLMSSWYCVAFPAMYCTAIMAAICLMVWSLYLFRRAVFDPEVSWRTYLFAAFGALCGALAFGCRPSIALGNILVIPLLITFLKTRRLTPKQLLYTALCALPYAAVAAGLMWYNNARFDNPFEFGQSYQLTVADQSQYGDILSRIDWKLLFENVKNALFRYDSGVLDYGVFVTFPILLLPVYVFARKACRVYLSNAGLGMFIPVALITVLAIVVVDVLWSPYLLPRYTMDYLWLLGIALFVAVGSLYQRERTNSRLTLIVSLLAAFTMVVCVCLFLTPYDANYANHRDLNLPWVRILLNW